MFEQAMLKVGKHASSKNPERIYQVPDVNANLTIPHTDRELTSSTTRNQNTIATEMCEKISPCKIRSQQLPSPVIKYHSYKRSKQGHAKKNDSSEKRNSATSSQSYPAAVGSARGNLVKQSTKDPTLSEFPLPTSSPGTSCTADVRSVTVPRAKSYTVLTNSPSISTFEHDEKSSERNANTSNLTDACDDTNNNSSANKKGPPENDASKVLVSAQEEKSSTSDFFSSETINSRKEDESETTTVTQKQPDLPHPNKEVHLPDPLPCYITKLNQPQGRVLNESLHCTTCDVYVNSESQMKQHMNSLRHKNKVQGIPVPPKPCREEKAKIRADHYCCNLCKVTLNSDRQLSQHLSSQRHKNLVDGKPPKPRWSPYERSQQGHLHQSPILRLSTKSLSTQSLLAHPQSAPPAVTSLSSLNGLSALSGRLIPTTNGLPVSAILKQASLCVPEGSLLQTQEIVYVGAPQLAALPPRTAIPGSFATVPNLLSNQQQLHLPQVVAQQPVAGLDWFAPAGSLRLST